MLVKNFESRNRDKTKHYRPEKPD